MSDEALIPLFEIVWASLVDLGAGLDDEAWAQPTELSGWTVKDTFAHLLGTESMLLGREAPAVTYEKPAYVKNAIGEANEAWVQARRQFSGAEILEEFRVVSGERLATLRAMSSQDFDADSWTPRGPGKYRDFMQVRIFDSWMHEQDVRRAVDKPGHLEGPVVEQALNEIERALPYIVGKKAAAPQDSTVVFRVSAPLQRDIAIGVDGRAGLLPEVPAEPNVTISGDVEAFAATTGGRWDPLEALEAGRLSIEGDEVLGRKILENCVFVI